MSQISQKRTEEKPPLQIGITGGIGSGKTTVCRIFEELGIPVYYADERAKALMVENQTVIVELKKLFGEEAYLPDGALNRKWIGAIVFQDGKKLKQLNAIVHPAVLTDGEEWHQRQANVPYTLKESALLFEIKSERFYDKTITVIAPKDVRIQRVMERDGLSKEAVEARMDKQLDDKRKRQLADYVIINDGQNLLIPQVLEIHRSLVEAFQLS